jgi:BirA family biotin operon repressor/biotin-[acetyl-CoA-carboxylase] ligase
MRVEIGRLARARGVRLLGLDDIDSTNDEAKRLVASGERGPLWVVAKRQTKGRGRLGREWISPPGNLHASLILSDFGPQRIAPQLGFVAGLAGLDALRAATSVAERLALKWPNDLLLDGAKLGGVLLEGVTIAAASDPAHNRMAAVIGIGVNCDSAPNDLPYEARALSALGAGAPSASTLFARLSDAMVDTLDVWAGGAGFPALRERWLALAAGLGGPIRVTLSRGESIEGRFKTIDASGRLVIDTHAGARIVDAGDVILARASAKHLEQSDARA